MSNTKASEVHPRFAEGDEAIQELSFRPVSIRAHRVFLVRAVLIDPTLSPTSTRRTAKADAFVLALWQATDSMVRLPVNRANKRKRSAMAARAQKQKLFGPGKNIHGNVVLNFIRPESEFGIYGAAFWRAGRTLATSLAKQNGYRDFDACPIVFLYAHALELYMKTIVRRGGSLVSLAGKKLPVDQRALTRHDLLPLTEPLPLHLQTCGLDVDDRSRGCQDLS